jgi:hypothetical protein
MEMQPIFFLNLIRWLYSIQHIFLFEEKKFAEILSVIFLSLAIFEFDW